MAVIVDHLGNVIDILVTIAAVVELVRKLLEISQISGIPNKHTPKVQ
jgi:hypothetical protein